MSKILVVATSRVTEADVRAARLGPKFGRLDLASQMAVLAVDSLGIRLEAWPRDRIGICLAVHGGSLSTDVDYWAGRDQPGGPSPALFTYTLPSSPLGEIAIRHGLTGPNVCFVGKDGWVLAEAADWLRQGLVDGCLCISCKVVSNAAAGALGMDPVANACAMFLQRAEHGPRELRENDRDMEALLDTMARA